MSSFKDRHRVANNYTHDHPHIDPDSITSLSFDQGSVRQAAQTLQEDMLHYYALLLLPVRLSLYDVHGVPLPKDVSSLLSGKPE